MKSTILVAFDESEPSTLALRTAVSAVLHSPKRDELQLVVTSVVEPPTPITLFNGFATGEVVATAEVQQMAHQRHLQVVNAVVQRAVDAVKAMAPEVDVSGSAHVGHVAEYLVGVVNDTMPLCVFIGTHGRKGVERFVLGSVAEALFRESKVPVIAIRANPDENANETRLSSFERIMIAYDGSEVCCQVPREVAQLASFLNPKELVLFCVREPFTETTGGPLTDAKACDFEQTEELLGDAERNLEQHFSGKVSHRIWEAPTNTASAIVEHAGNYSALAVGTHGRRGISRLFMGSVAERVVRSVPPGFPVIVINARYSSQSKRE